MDICLLLRFDPARGRAQIGWFPPCGNQTVVVDEHWSVLGK